MKSLILLSADDAFAAPLRQALERDDWICAVVPDLPSLLGLLKEVRPSMVLADLQATEDAAEVLRQLRADASLDGIPLVTVSEPYRQLARAQSARPRREPAGLLVFPRSNIRALPKALDKLVAA